MLDMRTVLENLVDAIPADVWAKLPNQIRNQAMVCLYPQPSPIDRFIEGYQQTLKEMSNA